MKISIKNNLTKFEVNPEFDIEGYIQIIKTTPLGIRPNNLLKSSEEISNFVRLAFQQQSLAISQKVFEIEKAWKIIEEKYIELSKSIFNIDDIPEYTYTCYPTICPLIARDPVKHRIAFPIDANSNLTCYVIAHELLHEFFYHHLYNLFGENVDLNRRDIWDLSEAVAVLIMQDKEWIGFFKIEPEAYPIHKELLEKLNPIWKKSKNIDEFLKRVDVF